MSLIIKKVRGTLLVLGTWQSESLSGRNRYGNYALIHPLDGGVFEANVPNPEGLKRYKVYDWDIVYCFGAPFFAPYFRQVEKWTPLEDSRAH